MPVILTFMDTRDLYSISVQTDSYVTCSRSCDEGKITKRLKDNRGWEKPIFQKKTTHLFFIFLIRIFIFLWKERVFVLFVKKHKTPLWIVFIASCNITIFKITQQLLDIPILAFKFEGKDMYPIFVFAKCCWSIHSTVVRLGRNADSKQRNATPTQTLQFHVKFMYMPC